MTIEFSLSQFSDDRICVFIDILELLNNDEWEISIVYVVIIPGQIIFFFSVISRERIIFKTVVDNSSYSKCQISTI